MSCVKLQLEFADWLAGRGIDDTAAKDSPAGRNIRCRSFYSSCGVLRSGCWLCDGNGRVGNRRYLFDASRRLFGNLGTKELTPQ